jgi:hypothetical protein
MEKSTTQGENPAGLMENIPEMLYSQQNLSNNPFRMKQLGQFPGRHPHSIQNKVKR